MKKKFASFLITGKAATLPFVTHNSSADNLDMLELVSGDQFHLVQTPNDNIQLVNSTEEGSVAARILIPGEGCETSPPKIMNVVLTGLQAGDEVYLAAADDTGGYEDIDPAFKIGQTNLTILANFVVKPMEDFGRIFDFPYKDVNLTKATHTLSVPVNLKPFDDKEEFYLQALVVRKNQWIFSELDRIEPVVQDCSDTDPYGGTY